MNILLFSENSITYSSKTVKIATMSYLENYDKDNSINKHSYKKSNLH